MPVYHSGKLSGTGRPNFNYPLRPTMPNLTPPFAPRNLMVTSPYNIGSTDIRWDNPKLIPQNNGYNVVGVNVYRSTENPYGPYEKLNTTPIEVLYFRDKIQEVTVTEDATLTLKHKQEPDNRWLVYSQRKPIIQPGTNGEIVSDRIEDIKVEIDNGDGNFLEVPAFMVTGRVGEVTLISYPTYNYTVNQIIPPRLPLPPNGKVKLTYTYLSNEVKSRLNQRIYYKVTTVAADPADTGKRIETPLDEVEWRSTFDIEEIDYIWREAIKRNLWILDQAGEHVKIFTRKWMGEKCPNYEYSHGQGHNDCELCFGTNYIGGYFGPVDIVIAPPEAEKSIELLDMGLHIRYDFETWTGPFPLLNERDVIVRQSNERYVVGPVNYQGSRGAIYQQHFTITYVDEKDIRYRIGISGGETTVPESSDLYREARKSEASPVIPIKPNIPEERLIKGRTVTFENIMF
jgi:hypothetical protein